MFSRLWFNDPKPKYHPLKSHASKTNLIILGSICLEFRAILFQFPVSLQLETLPFLCTYNQALLQDALQHLVPCQLTSCSFCMNFFLSCSLKKKLKAASPWACLVVLVFFHLLELPSTILFEGFGDRCMGKIGISLIITNSMFSKINTMLMLDKHFVRFSP